MRLTSLLRSLAVASLLLAPRAHAADADSDGSAAASREQDAAQPTATHLSVRASAGGATRALFDVPVFGGEGDLGVGFDSHFGSFGLVFALFGGVVEGGLVTLHGTLGADFMWPVGDFRFGFRPRVGYLDIDRVTTDRQFGAYSLGLVARASYDLTRSDGVAFAIGVEPSAEVVAALGNDGRGGDGAGPLVGGRAFLEVRWRRDD